MAPPDRDAILARRALFIASTLAGLGATKSAAAQAPEPVASEAEPCRTPTDTNPEALATARELARQGIAMMTAGDYQDAVMSFAKAYELYPHPSALFLLAQAERAQGDHASALKHLRTFVRCAPDHKQIEEAKTIVAALEAELGRLMIEGPAGVEVHVDGKPAGKLPLAEPILLPAGAHSVSAARPECEPEHVDVTLQQGEERTITLKDECVPPMPCLQPCLVPPPRSDRVLRFGVGVAPLLMFETFEHEERGLAFGARAEVFYHVPLGESGAMRLGLTAMPSALHAGALIPIGLDLEAAATAGPVRMGVGVSGGYAIATGDGPDSGGFSPVSSPFIYPYVVPAGVLLGDHVELGPHFGLMLSRHESQSSSRFAPTWISAGIFVRVLLGSPEERDEQLARLPLLTPVD